MSDDNDRDLLEWLGADEAPSVEALAFADRAIARATIQPGRSALESARLAIAYEFDILREVTTGQAARGKDAT